MFFANKTIELAPLFPLLHQVLHPAFPECLWLGDCDRPEVALTFDDGPHPEYTPQLLDILDFYQVQASFFCLGACVDRAPHVARMIVERGHSLGLHGYDHRSFPWLSPLELQQTLEQTQQAIARACDLDPTTIRDVRPPNGLFTPQTLQLLKQWQYRPVMWSVVPEDWVQPGVPRVTQRIFKQVRNGSIIVLHDGAYGGKDVAEATAKILPQLLSQGYQFVTIEQLWLRRGAQQAL